MKNLVKRLFIKMKYENFIKITIYTIFILLNCMDGNVIIPGKKILYIDNLDVLSCMRILQLKKRAGKLNNDKIKKLNEQINGLFAGNNLIRRYSKKAIHININSIDANKIDCEYFLYNLISRMLKCNVSVKLELKNTASDKMKLDLILYGYNENNELLCIISNFYPSGREAVLLYTEWMLIYESISSVNMSVNDQCLNEID